MAIGPLGSIIPSNAEPRSVGDRSFRSQSRHDFLEDHMNWDRIEGNWKQFSGKAKESWGKLTDDDIAVVNGKRDQLVGKIQNRYGIAKDEADKQVRDWESKL
jgi:uncharacterized protein YjbJ (UPF0337 family)